MSVDPGYDISPEDIPVVEKKEDFVGLEEGITIEEDVAEIEPKVAEPKQEKQVWNNPLSDMKKLTLGELLDSSNSVLTSLIRNVTKETLMAKIDELDVDKIEVEESAAIMHNVNSQDDIRASFYKRNISELTNEVSYGKTEIKIKTPMVKKNTDVKSVNLARLKAHQAMGLSGRTSIPLVNSGFWITVEAIGDKELLDLNYRLMQNDITLGRKTNGAIYSNDAIIYEQIIKEFVEENLIFTTLNVPLEEVFDYILIEDYDYIIVNLAHALFPMGFDIRIPCKNTLVLDENNKPKCSSVLSFNCDPVIMLNIIGEKFTDKHRKILGEVIPNSVSLNDIAEYQKDSYKETYSFVEIKVPNDTITVNFKSVTIPEKITAGVTWVNNIVKQAEEVMTIDVNDVDRKLAMDDYGRQSRLNTYIHYIDSVVYSDGTVITHEDGDMLMETLSAFSNSDSTEFMRQLIKGINFFIKDKTIHTFGIPEYKCNVCNEDNSSEVEGFGSDIIPMDPMRVFFRLATVKRAKMKGTDTI